MRTITTQHVRGLQRVETTILPAGYPKSSTFWTQNSRGWNKVIRLTDLLLTGCEKPEDCFVARSKPEFGHQLSPLSRFTQYAMKFERQVLSGVKLYD